MKARLVAALLLTLLAASGAALAQCREDWTGNVAVNFTLPAGSTADLINGVGGITAGVTYQPDGWPVGILAELSRNRFDAPSWPVTTEVPGQNAYLYGKVELWSLTANAVWSAQKHGPASYYALVGFGAFRHTATISSPGGYDQVSWCNPWSGQCTPGLVPVGSVVGSQTVTKFGYGIGFGFTYWVACATQLYLEVRYNWVATSKASQYVPISLGLRF